jgi:hypothetical protein
MIYVKQYSTVYKYHIFFSLSSLERYLSSFQSLAIVNRDAINIGVQGISVGCRLIFFLIYDQKWYSRVLCLFYPIFRFSKQLFTTFQSDGTNLHSHQWFVSFPFVLSYSPTFVTVRLMIVILTGRKQKKQCCFDLNILYGYQCWTFLNVFIAHLYFF